MENNENINNTQTSFETKKTKNCKLFSSFYLTICILTCIGFFSSFAPTQQILEIITFSSSIVSLILLIIMFILWKFIHPIALKQQKKKFILLLIVNLILVAILIGFSGYYALFVLATSGQIHSNDWQSSYLSWLTIIPGFANIGLFILSINSFNIAKTFSIYLNKI
ncbi:MAG: hypothetical protein LBB39_00175 [Mycoplasmataceae bacterium]|nr:hypothetical protein [Mycoplasmataceae bacterium]